MTPEEIPQELVDLLDERAGKQHSRTGTVLSTLAEILTRSTSCARKPAMPRRSPAQIQRWLDEHLHRLDLPAQWLGDEPNAARKPWDTATVRWLMAASWVYEAAAGNSSIPAVYKAVNDARPGFLCDRTYLPATPRDLGLLHKAGIGQFGIESKHQMRDFDVVGTSISYPVLAMSLVKQLSMSDIPIRWRDRDPGAYPMVVAGGQAFGAPEMLAPVVDCWWLGEVEDEEDNPGIGAVCDRIARHKSSGAWQEHRLDCYADLAREFNFLYFPRFVDVHYHHEDRTAVGVGPHPSKQVAGFTANLPGMRLPLRKRHVKNLDNVAPLTDPPLLYADPAMGSGDLEVARGCPAWCSFCALSWRTKPYRQRTVGNVLTYAKQFQDNMGSVRMAPFSPDFPMYTQKKKLIAGLLEQVSDEVDAPTMRVDDFIADNEFMLLQVHGGMDAVTLGVEGNSQRMRDLVGKGTSDEDIKEAVTRGIRAGIRKFKLYMISNLPGEDEGDAMRILQLAKDLADIRESMHQPTVRIQLSWTPLMIEANTPFQWFAPQLSSRVLGDVWEECRDLKIDTKLGAKGEPNKFAFFQLCQRASRHVGEAIVDAMEIADQACWGGVPRTFKETLEQQLHKWGFQNGFADCFDERFQHDMFGWEFIDQGASSEIMWATYQQMREFVEQTDSGTYDSHFDANYHGSEWVARCDQRCMGKTCGACTPAELKIRTGYIRAAQTERRIDLATLTPVDQRSQAFRIRARLIKTAEHRFVDNSHWRFAVRRAAFRAQTALNLSHGIAKRSIRFASDGVRHRDWTGGVDYVEFGITRPMHRDDIQTLLDVMAGELQPWMQLGAWNVHPANATTMRANVDLSLFDLEVDEPAATVQRRLQQWQATEHVPMRLKVEGGYFAPNSEEVNAKDHVEQLWLVRDGHRLRLRMLIRGRPSPYNIYAALMHRASWLDAAANPATRLEAFVSADRSQQDFLRPNCRTCGLQVPTTVLDEPYDAEYCPPCKDRHDGVVIEHHDDL